MLVYYINVFKDAFWPNGKLAPSKTSRTELQRQETKQRAQQKLLENIPGELRTVPCILPLCHQLLLLSIYCHQLYYFRMSAYRKNIFELKGELLQKSKILYASSY
ncbi:hypothetical protein XELAEV_18009120mg [Xenopus laevis]|uniref:Sorting nexin C-terminal domain-containing protein n=1 Tax=Xenopus laevis TaxID=8355 RepID=A0A974I0H7_XENLA|nr:hypothetical protein XELAEV_18009120mg [Xenopus laevis]